MQATTKQQSFIARLLNERQPEDHLRVEATAETLTKQQASGIIERLLNAPRAEVRRTSGVAAEVRVTDPGVYRHEGEVYIVKPNREKTKLYAKRLVEIGGGTRVTETGEHVNIEFEYAPGAIYKLSPADRMPYEDAKALTARYGRCIVCGRHLKDATSVERGIGPVCATYFTTASTTEPQPVERVTVGSRVEITAGDTAGALGEVTGTQIGHFLVKRDGGPTDIHKADELAPVS